MKTFGSYFFEFIKILAFGGLLAWAFSCSDSEAIVRQIHQYEDSIGMARVNLLHIDIVGDSIYNSYVDNYGARVFPRTREGMRQAEAFSDSEHVAYAAFLAAQAKHEVSTSSERDMHENNIMRFKRIIDSLKLELEK